MSTTNPEVSLTTPLQSFQAIQNQTNPRRTKSAPPEQVSNKPMPGRVKHRPTKTLHRNLHHHLTRATAAAARMASTTSTFLRRAPPFVAAGLSKQAIIWISILSALVVATLIFISLLLCRCTLTRKARAARKRHDTGPHRGHSYHESLEVTDGRNDHFAWNRRYAPAPGTGSKGQSGGPDGDGFMLTPLRQAAVRPAGREAGVIREPVVVEEDEALSPLSPRSPAPGGRNGKGLEKGSRYYSGFSGAWKRISQIGRAY